VAIILGWDWYEKAISHLIRSFVKDGVCATAIVGVGRGGAVPAAELAHYFNILADKFGFINMMRRVSEHGDLMEPKIFAFAIPNLSSADTLAIVEDIVYEGKTLAAAENLIMSNCAPKKIITASLAIEEGSKAPPDYYYFTTNEYLVFPWERVYYLREAYRVS
jgi:hypoxanthine phosphoribosyltransferase